MESWQLAVVHDGIILRAEGSNPAYLIPFPLSRGLVMQMQLDLFPDLERGGM